ncbi:MAG TPA: septation protein SepH [Frankiaceae bacterium]
MRQLHVWGLSDDGRQLLLAQPGDQSKPSHSLLIDERLHRAVRGEPLDPDELPRELSPREIQARLRAGASPEEVAAQAGVPLVRVARFAGPVLSERAKVVDQVQAAVLVRPRVGPSVAPVGDCVESWLAETPHVQGDSAAWSAGRQPDGTWIITFRVVVRSRPRTARWALSPVGQVTALDTFAVQLGHREHLGVAGLHSDPVPGARRASRPGRTAADRSPAPDQVSRAAQASRGVARPAAGGSAPSAWDGSAWTEPDAPDAPDVWDEPWDENWDDEATEPAPARPAAARRTAGRSTPRAGGSAATRRRRAAATAGEGTAGQGSRGRSTATPRRPTAPRTPLTAAQAAAQTVSGAALAARALTGVVPTSPRSPGTEREDRDAGPVAELPETVVVEEPELELTPEVPAEEEAPAPRSRRDASIRGDDVFFPPVGPSATGGGGARRGRASLASSTVADLFASDASGPRQSVGRARRSGPSDEAARRRRPAPPTGE